MNLSRGSVSAKLMTETLQTSIRTWDTSARFSGYASVTGALSHQGWRRPEA
jgi:hypothetical protein